MPQTRMSATVLEHLVYAEGYSFGDALRIVRREMLAQQQEESRAESLLFGSALANIAIAVPLLTVSAPAGLVTLLGGGCFLYFSKQFQRTENELTRSGEASLWSNSEILTWIVRLWEAGIPEGQLITGYAQYCEQIALAQVRGDVLPIKQSIFNGYVGDAVDLFAGAKGKALPADIPVEKLPQPQPQLNPIVHSSDVSEVHPMPENQPELPPFIPMPDFEALRKQRPKEAPSGLPPFGRQAAVQTLERQYEAAVTEEKQEQVAIVSAKTAKDRLLANTSKSRVWLGGERTGKSYGVAQTTKAMDGVHIYHFNLASFEDGSGREDDDYWGHAEQTFCCDLDFDADTDTEAQQLIGEAYRIFKAWKQDKNPCILIVDEWTIITGKKHRFAKQLQQLTDAIAAMIGTLSSSGTKRGKAIWLISPEVVAGKLSDSGLAMKCLPLCYVAIPKGKTIQWKDKAIGFDASLHGQVGTNYAAEAVPVPTYDAENDRLCWLNGDWLPLGW